MTLSTSIVPSPTSASSSDHSLPRRKQRVSAEHTLNRVRENQRRHRARQRDHVVSLELKLAETERQLAATKAEIEALKAERDTANAFACYDISKHFERLDSAVAIGSSSILPLGLSSPSTVLDLPMSSNATEPTLIATSFQLLLPPMPVVGPPPCCTDTILTTSTPSEPSASPLINATPGIADPECSTCKTRPSPSPSESTTLCAQAFVMISQQNVRNMDPELIRMWLSHGYRRAMREGEGCRVENRTLKGLLEYISGV
ncbi:hypothetical protein BU25DRAFT_415356 [Macroventuria anomochaeta]|uniref:Uncharacterized protein n=1 Tax=Macroventuria anomochaeta TaxID=301207 RepID=A0ACB6RKM6_9PLEO|nr:uncharacterized protein BU25DRAFT_415356 [Macroventuria anomochaeta]KAF2622426.1 hypothetical protein BU25DRAFT_415356 [Macroventuria anomochaeta]